MTEISEEQDPHEHVNNDDVETLVNDGEATPEKCGKNGSTKSSPISAFLPPQHSLWTWSDTGYRQNTKSRRLFHKRISKDDMESLAVGDCAVFLSTSRPDRPYIGKINSMWQTSGGNHNKHKWENESSHQPVNSYNRGILQLVT